ncbi:MAG: hypothetical protein F6K10_40850 [Moorea sp. SIO2B7]|nr:hypothetical protein [Moorena sp. SIO2B7]
MNLNLTPKTIFKKLSLFVVFMTLANLIGITIQLFPGHGRFYYLISLFDFNGEYNIPALYSSLTLIFSALLLAIIAMKHKKIGSSYIPWLGLAIIFVFLSVDEMTSLHEQLTGPVQQSLNTSGLFYYAWVIPYTVALGIFVTLYFRFLMRLPKRTRSLFIVSGVIFIFGAIGFELLGGLQDSLHGSTNLLYRLLFTCEEFLEMFGIVVFIYALFDYMITEFGFLKVIIDRSKTERSLKRI